MITRVGIILGIYLFKAFFWLCGIMIDIFLAVFTSVMSENKPRTVESPVRQLASPGKTRGFTMYHAETGGLSVQRPRHHSTLEKEFDIDDRVQRVRPVEYNFMVQKQSEEIFESSPEPTGNHDLVMRKDQLLKSSERPIERRSNEKNRKVKTVSQYSPFKRRLPSQSVASMSTAVALTLPVDISSSLSDKMRKRRLGEGENKGYSIVTGGDNGATSRKKRKLNTGRMPLLGCVARRPTKGAWQTTKILHKREREVREERLLRAMSRKRSKPSLEKPEHLASAPTSTVSPALSTPGFKFGQTNVVTSTSSPISKEKSASFAANFQFGSNGNGALLPSKIEGTTVASERRSESAAQSSAGFSFGNTSPNAVNNDTSGSKTQAPNASDPPSVPQFRLKTNDGSDNKIKPSEQVPLKLGLKHSTPADSAAPFLGAAVSDSTNVKPTITAVDPAVTVASISSTKEEPKLSFGTTQAALTQAPTAAPAAPSFGGNSSAAPTSSTVAGSSGPSFGTSTPAAPVFGATAAAPINFGASSDRGTANSFGSGSSHQPTNTSAPSYQLGSQPAKSASIQMPIGNTKENTNPGSFNATAVSNGFSKPQAINGNFNPPLGMNGGFATGTGNGAPTPAFVGVNAGGMPGFSAGAAPVAATGASARRMARKSRNRRR